MDLYFVQSLNESSKIISISGEEVHHIVKVKRYKAGDRIFLTNGCGLISEVELIKVTKDYCEVSVLAIQKFEKAKREIIALFPLLRNPERFEFGIEKLTELGISEIIPFYSKRTLKKKLKLERAQKILISAIKQSINPFLPKLHEPLSLEDALNINFRNDLILFGNIEGERLSVVVNKFNLKSFEKIFLLVGPEGDFSEEELVLLKSKNACPVNLSKNRLRSETALICLLAQLKNFLDE
ncbi:MAG: 16S rRNA (uracil(1498)-N(3))-methyltransferase [Ignavibacteria bacterium]|nr:16S rRNA (uracil(1498)-N(3))-methyltransferase [Ignavibacteria bacterium]